MRMLSHLLEFLRNRLFASLKVGTTNSPLTTCDPTPNGTDAVSNVIESGAAETAYQAGNWEVAERLCRMVLALEPRNIEALNLLGNISAQTERSQEAVDLLSYAASLDPNRADLLNNLGIALQNLKRSEEALEIYQRAILLRPAYTEALINRGNTLSDLGLHQAALESFEQAITLKPESADNYINRGNALSALKRHDAALQSYEQAIALEPKYAEAYYNRGETLLELHRLEDALESLQRALTLKPDMSNLYGLLVHAKMRLCNWEDLRHHIDNVSERIERGERASAPFPLLGFSSSPALQRKASEIWQRAEYPSGNALPKIAICHDLEKIRIGYFSADFHDHATTRLIAELFEKHDRSRFELTAFSFGPDTRDAMRRRVIAAFDRFIDVRGVSDLAVATQARDLKIDIAVDLKGYCQDSRAGIFALRAAPVQVSYLGYPGTTGADYIDYLIADETLIPTDCLRHYSEKIVYLPYSYQVNDSKRPIANIGGDRGEMGLPEKGFVFCCFNNIYKITPEFFDRWMRILTKVDGSVLWLLADDSGAASNLRDEAARRGVEESRLVFANHVPLVEHLARHHLADLFLDTLPCNAHTTASDALWAGLPVLTCLGQTFAGRVAASLLNGVRLPELIAASGDEYERLAVELAVDQSRLVDIRQRLAENRETAPLFDIKMFTRHIEAGYVAMHERFQANIGPEHIYIPRD